MNQRDLIRVKCLRPVSLVLFLILPVTCTRHPRPTSFDRQIVAIVGEDTITVGQFKQSYETAMLKTAETDNDDTRRLHLDQMIDGYLLAQEAKRAGIDTVKSYQKFREQVTREIMRKYQYHEVTEDIDVDENQLKEAFRRSQESRLVRHLYSKSRQQIEKWYQALADSSASFRSLAKIAFSDEKLQNSGGLLGWISWGDTDYRFENEVYSLNKGKISRPFQSVNGWHIIRVEAIKRNLISSNLDYEEFKLKNREKLIRIYQQAQLAKYLTDFMQAQDLKLNIPLLRKIEPEIKNIYRQMISPDDVYLTHLPGSTVEMVAEQLKDYKEYVLVSSDDRQWTVGDFIKRIPELPAKFIFNEFDKAVAFAVRNDILAEMAYSRGLDKLPEVREQIELKSDDYLARLESEVMIQSIPIVKKENFTDEDSQLYQLQQWRKKRREFLDNQKNKTPITKDYDILSKITFSE